MLGKSAAKKPRKTIVDGIRYGSSKARKGAAIIPHPIPKRLCALDAIYTMKKANKTSEKAICEKNASIIYLKCI